MKSKLSVPPMASVFLRNKSQHLASFLKDSHSSFSCLKWRPVTLASSLFPQPPRKTLPQCRLPRCGLALLFSCVSPASNVIFTMRPSPMKTANGEPPHFHFSPHPSLMLSLQSIHHRQTSVNWFICSFPVSHHSNVHPVTGTLVFCSCRVPGVSTRLGTCEGDFIK